MASRLATKNAKLSERFNFFREQNHSKRVSQRRVLDAILREEADAAAARLGVQRPSEMSDFERRRVSFIQNMSLKNKAYLSLLGFDLRIFPSEVVQPDVTQRVLPRFGKIATLFTPFAVGLALSSPVGMIPSVVGLATGACGFGLLRASVAARILIEESPNVNPDESHYEWKRNELELFSVFSGIAGLAAVGSVLSNPLFIPAVSLIPGSWFLAMKTENPLIRTSLLAASAPLGLLAGGAVLDIYTLSEASALGGLVWAGWTGSHWVFTQPKVEVAGDFLKAAAFSATCLLAAASPLIGNMHRGFIIFGVPAVSSLFAQAYTNTYRPDDVLKYGWKAQGSRKFGLQERHAFAGMLFLLAFMTGRAYSTAVSTGGFAIVYGDQQKF